MTHPARNGSLVMKTLHDDEVIEKPEMVGHVENTLLRQVANVLSMFDDGHSGIDRCCYPVVIDESAQTILEPAEEWHTEPHDGEKDDHGRDAGHRNDEGCHHEKVRGACK